MDNDWSDDIECILEAIRQNCMLLAKEHRRNYFSARETLKYFKIPVILLSSINSICSVGLKTYLAQDTISMMTCLLALVCSVIGSVELYLAIQKEMETALQSQRDYYLLGIDIYKTLSLVRDHRPPAKEYLEKQYSEYCKLIENSAVVAKKIEDKLSPLPVIINSLNSRPSTPQNYSSKSSLENIVL